MRLTTDAERGAAATALRIDLMKVVRTYMPWPFTDVARTDEEARVTAYAVVDEVLPQITQSFDEIAAGLPTKPGKRRGKIIDVQPVKAAATRAPKAKKKVAKKAKRRAGRKK